MVPIDDVVFFDVVTHDPATGGISDADSTPTFEVFEESTDTDIGVGGNLTKRTSKTGNYRGSFTASAANGFEAGKWYSVIASATVGGVSAKTVAMSFRVAPAETSPGVPDVNTASVGGTTQTGGDIVGLIGTPSNSTVSQDIADVRGQVDTITAGVADIQGRIPSALGTDGFMQAEVVEVEGVDADTYFSQFAPASTALSNATWTNARAAKLDNLSGDAFARLGAPAGASVSADIAAAKVDTAAIKLKTDNLPASPASTTNITAGTITTVTNLTNAPTNGDLTAAMKASINAECDTALADYDAPTKAELDSAAALLATNAQLVKVLAAVYDSVARSGNVLALSNGATQTISSTGRATT